MRYEASDIIVMRTDLEPGIVYDAVYFNTSMKEMLGKELEIKRVGSNSYRVFYKRGWTISDSMIDHEKTNLLKEREEAADRAIPIELVRPSLALSTESLRKLVEKNKREMSWKRSDIEQWKESIDEAKQFIDRMEVRNESLTYAIQLLEDQEYDFNVITGIESEEGDI